MNYDDALKIECNIPDEDFELSGIMERLREQYPEYALPGAVVTPGFIEMIVQLIREDLHIEAIEAEEFEDSCRDEARSIISMLPESLIADPLLEDTVERIMAALARHSHNWLMERYLFRRCKNAAEYCRRATIKEKLGLYEEALKDYEAAVRLEPDEIPYILDRAEAKKKCGDNAGALQDTKWVFDRIGGSLRKHPEHLLETIRLVHLFHRMKEARLAVHALIKYLQALNAYLDLDAVIENGKFVLTTDNCLHEEDLCSFEGYISMVREIEAIPDPTPPLQMLLNKVKEEIVLFRSRAGF